jgi:hypothetical protein
MQLLEVIYIYVCVCVVRRLKVNGHNVHFAGVLSTPNAAYFIHAFSRYELFAKLRKRFKILLVK